MREILSPRFNHERREAVGRIAAAALGLFLIGGNCKSTAPPASPVSFEPTQDCNQGEEIPPPLYREGDCVLWIDQKRLPPYSLDIERFNLEDLLKAREGAPYPICVNPPLDLANLGLPVIPENNIVYVSPQDPNKLTPPEEYYLADPYILEKSWRGGPQPPVSLADYPFIRNQYFLGLGGPGSDGKVSIVYAIPVRPGLYERCLMEDGRWRIAYYHFGDFDTLKFGEESLIIATHWSFYLLGGILPSLPLSLILDLEKDDDRAIMAAINYFRNTRGLPWFSFRPDESGLPIGMEVSPDWIPPGGRDYYGREENTDLWKYTVPLAGPTTLPFGTVNWYFGLANKSGKLTLCLAENYNNGGINLTPQNVDFRAFAFPISLMLKYNIDSMPERVDAALVVCRFDSSRLGMAMGATLFSEGFLNALYGEAGLPSPTVFPSFLRPSSFLRRVRFQLARGVREKRGCVSLPPRGVG